MHLYDWSHFIKFQSASFHKHKVFLGGKCVASGDRRHDCMPVADWTFARRRTTKIIFTPISMHLLPIAYDWIYLVENIFTAWNVYCYTIYFVLYLCTIYYCTTVYEYYSIYILHTFMYHKDMYVLQALSIVLSWNKMS